MHCVIALFLTTFASVGLVGVSTPDWLGLSIVAVGGLVGMISALGLMFVAFQQHPLWGVGMLFVPLLQWVFAALHWEKARSVFLAHLAGTVLILLGLMMTV